MLNPMSVSSGGETAIHPTERPAAIRVVDACVGQFVHASEDDHAIRCGVGGCFRCETKHGTVLVFGRIHQKHLSQS